LAELLYAFPFLVQYLDPEPRIGEGSGPPLKKAPANETANVVRLL
jgi:hypothetical protein